MNYIKNIIKLLEVATKNFTPPLIDRIIDEYGKNPYLILIACLLSLRAKDSTTIHVCRDLFAKAQTPQAMLKISRAELEKIVFKAGFYKNKAKAIHEVSRAILSDFDGKVPQTYDELISIKGVGPKTANLVLGMAFGIPAICVDTHVHRISNSLGIVKTKTPEQTLIALEKILDKKDWIRWNRLLVMLGQNVCTPTSPKCSYCALSRFCVLAKKNSTV
jgi:endonuclease-3